MDCLLHYRNAYYHRHLDRRVALDILENVGSDLELGHEIPARMPSSVDPGETANPPEEILKLVLERAELTEFTCQHAIDLGKPFGVTTPDFFFNDPSGRFEGICIYLDGMSRHLHGKSETAKRDREIREELRGRFFEVIEIRASQLDDAQAMKRHLSRLGRLLLGEPRTN